MNTPWLVMLLFWCDWVTLSSVIVSVCTEIDPPCDRIVERLVHHFSVRQGSHDYMYAAMHAVMYILWAFFAVTYTMSLSPFGTHQQYGDKGGMVATIKIPQVCPKPPQTKWQRTSTQQVEGPKYIWDTYWHRVCLRRRHWQTNSTHIQGPFWATAVGEISVPQKND